MPLMSESTPFPVPAALGHGEAVGGSRFAGRGAEEEGEEGEDEVRRGLGLGGGENNNMEVLGGGGIPGENYCAQIRDDQSHMHKSKGC